MQQKQILNATGNTIDNIEQEQIKMDNQIKEVLSCKPILAVIFSEVVVECKGMSTEEIINCIEGDVKIEQEPILPTEKITGNSQEDFQLGEGMIRYDIKTYLRLPISDKPSSIKIIVDIEAQKNDSPGYDIVTRGIFYCCRMVSAQLNTEFSLKSDDSKKYDNIKKVYSIWICTETPNYKKNTIEKYSITKEMLYGESSKDNRYDLMTVIVVNIGKIHDDTDTESRLLNVLNTLTDEKLTASVKIQALKKENVAVTEELIKEVESMTSYTAGLIKKYQTEGRAEGRAEGMAKGEAKLLQLICKLYEQNRSDEVLKATTDASFRKKLYEEFNLDN